MCEKQSSAEAAGRGNRGGGGIWRGDPGWPLGGATVHGPKASHQCSNRSDSDVSSHLLRNGCLQRATASWCLDEAYGAVSNEQLVT